jgi:hypothetical protein
MVGPATHVKRRRPIRVGFRLGRQCTRRSSLQANSLDWVLLPFRWSGTGISLLRTDQRGRRARADDSGTFRSASAQASHPGGTRPMAAF